MSNYEGFNVNLTGLNGNITQLESVTVKVRRADTDTDIGTLVTDASGYIAAGSFSVPVGTELRFRVENYHGLAGCVIQKTT
jgi:hypothetical protein